jgi:hypothetical protein
MLSVDLDFSVMVLRLPGSWHRKDPKKIFMSLHFSLLVAVLFTMVAPLVGVARKILVAGTKFSDTPPSELATSMAGPSGVLLAGPAAATTRVGDVDGGPPRGCCR